MLHNDFRLGLLYGYVDVQILTPKERVAGGVFSCTIRAYTYYGEHETR